MSDVINIFARLLTLLSGWARSGNSEFFIQILMNFEFFFWIYKFWKKEFFSKFPNKLLIPSLSQLASTTKHGREEILLL